MVAGAGTRHPLLTRGYVTCTRFETGEGSPGLDQLVAEMDEGLAKVGQASLPQGHRALAVAQLTTHAGHFMGAARSHLLVSQGADGTALRDVGVWDPMPLPQRTAYLLGGKEAQQRFWGEGPPESSMLHQFAAPETASR